MQVPVPILLTGLILSLLLSGCRQADRIAWAVDTRTFAPSAWPMRGPQEELAHLKETQGLAHYMAGLLAEARGDLKTAQRRYVQSRAYSPDVVQVTLRLGAVHLRKNELDRAVAAFELATQLNPADPRSRFLLGILYASESRFDEAAQQYAEVLNQDPGNLGALSHLADLYALQEKLEEGLAVYEQLLEERPDSSQAHFNVGVLYAKAENWERSVEHMQKAVELDPVYLEARLGLAVGLELLDRPEEAKQEFLSALELEPANTQLIHYLGKISYRMGDLEESERWLTRYLSFKPRDHTAHLELAYVRIDGGRWEEAIRQIELALDLYGLAQAPHELWMVLGVAYQTGEVFPKAEAAYRRAIQMSPQSSKPYLYLGALLQRLENYETAESVYRQALDINSENPDLLNSLGYLYAEWGKNLQNALELIEKALELDPGNGAYLDSLGWVYFKMGRLQLSLKILQEAVERMEDSEILDHLGQVYLSLDQFRQAKEAWERALALDPQDSKLRLHLEHQLKSLKRVSPRKKRRDR